MLTRDELFTQLRLMPSKKNILIAYHAETTLDCPWEPCRVMLDALRTFEASFLVLGTNADTGSEAINALLTEFVEARPDRLWRGNLPPELFYGCLAYFDCMVGNSSAGLVETATFGIPVVNIGERQSGRTSPLNVTTCKPEREAIEACVTMALRTQRQPKPNPYGDGKSASRIARVIYGMA